MVLNIKRASIVQIEALKIDIFNFTIYPKFGILLNPEVHFELYQ